MDYIALKRLAVQLFQGDAEALQVTDLTDLILSQPQVGTTIKCDGKESDPYAFLTAVNMHVHQVRPENNHRLSELLTMPSYLQTRPSVKALTEYVLSKSSPEPSFHSALQSLLSPAGLQSQNHVGFVFSERLINMPVQTVPPMYRMLEEEVKRVVQEVRPGLHIPSVYDI